MRRAKKNWICFPKAERNWLVFYRRVLIANKFARSQKYRIIGYSDIKCKNEKEKSAQKKIAALRAAFFSPVSIACKTHFIYEEKCHHACCKKEKHNQITHCIASILVQIRNLHRFGIRTNNKHFEWSDSRIGCENNKFSHFFGSIVSAAFKILNPQKIQPAAGFFSESLLSFLHSISDGFFYFVSFILELDIRRTCKTSPTSSLAYGRILINCVRPNYVDGRENTTGYSTVKLDQAVCT